MPRNPDSGGLGILFVIVIHLLVPSRGLEARAEGWERSGAFEIVSPGGDLEGIPSGPGLKVGAGKKLGTILCFSADIGVSLHRIAGVDVYYLMASPGLAASFPLGKTFNVKLSYGCTAHLVDYAQVPIRLQGTGPFVGLEMATRTAEGKFGLQVMAHRFDLEDTRNIRSEGWTLCAALRFPLP